MGIRLRLSRHHLTRNSPAYSLVATLSSARPTAQPLERLGEYAPTPAVVPAPSRSPNGHQRSQREWGARQFAPRTAAAEVGQKQVQWNLERVRWWLSQGAIPSKPVERLLVQAGVIQTNPRPAPTQTGLVMSRQRRIREAVRAAEKERGEVPVAQR
ncbi:37S ribosomal protein S16, mitochondrial [Rhodotorula kratochvilovae]